MTDAGLWGGIKVLIDGWAANPVAWTVGTWLVPGVLTAKLVHRIDGRSYRSLKDMGLFLLVVVLWPVFWMGAEMLYFGDAEGGGA